jgi:hypothetical protein
VQTGEFVAHRSMTRGSSAFIRHWMRLSERRPLLRVGHGQNQRFCTLRPTDFAPFGAWLIN